MASTWWVCFNLPSTRRQFILYCMVQNLWAKQAWRVEFSSVCCWTFICVTSVKHLFSLMNRIKTDFWNSLKQECLGNLLSIHMEGLDLQDFNPVPATQLWHDPRKLWRPNQKKRKEYRKQARNFGWYGIFIWMWVWMKKHWTIIIF